ncbi:hypothetical protein PRIPAC_74572, partial [Pristionchus pacificus]
FDNALHYSSYPRPSQLWRLLQRNWTEMDEDLDGFYWYRNAVNSIDHRGFFH